MKMLEYENEMFLSALQEDGLTITAKGLGLETVFLSLLKVVIEKCFGSVDRFLYWHTATGTRQNKY